jgi:hypothetical protein
MPGRRDAAVRGGGIRVGARYRVYGDVRLFPELARRKKWSPWFRRIIDEGFASSPERPAAMVLSLVSGLANALSGRFLQTTHNLELLLASAAEKRTREALFSAHSKAGSRAVKPSSGRHSSRSGRTRVIAPEHYYGAHLLKISSLFFHSASNLPYSLVCELTPPKCPEIAVNPGAPLQGRRRGESESPQEEAIEIGNS